MVPYGNAQASGSRVQCQHGFKECEGNRWEQCAIAHYPKVSDHFPFYLCMEQYADKMLAHVRTCAAKAGLDYSTLSTCYHGPESKQLQKKFAALTPANHKYVPWVVVNGKRSKSDGDKLLAEVCKAYKGTKPAGCTKVLQATAAAVNSTKTKLCYV